MGDGEGAQTTANYFTLHTDTTQQMVIVYAFSQLGACPLTSCKTMHVYTMLYSLQVSHAQARYYDASRRECERSPRR